MPDACAWPHLSSESSLALLELALWSGIPWIKFSIQHFCMSAEGPPTPAKHPSAAPCMEISPVSHTAAPVPGSFQTVFAALLQICPDPDLKVLAAQWLAEPALEVVPPLTEAALLY